MDASLLMYLKDIEEERGIPHQQILSLLEESIIRAYKKKYGGGDNIRIEWDKKKGMKIIITKKAVEEVVDPDYEIPIEEARKLRPKLEVEEFIDIESNTKDFSRVVAMTVRTTLSQELRKVERGMVYETFRDRVGELVSGKIQRVSRGNVFLTIGGVEALLPRREQIPNDTYVAERNIRVVIIEVKEGMKGAQVIVSRAHPDLVRRLFESEIVEFSDGVLEVKGVAREAGYRTKISIQSKNPEIDPIGTCIGQRGTRIQTIMRELNGEKIDIIEWREDPKEFIVKSLSPAPVLEVHLDNEEGEASVIVPGDKQSLAIGKSGQNVRLAAKLTGWKIDIKSDAEVKKRQAVTELDAIQGIQREFEDTLVKDLDGIGEKTLQKLIDGGLTEVKEVLNKSPEDLAEIPGIGVKTAEKILKAIYKLKEKADKDKEEALVQAAAVQQDDVHELESFVFEDGREAKTIGELEEIASSLSPEQRKVILERGDFEAWLEYAEYTDEQINDFLERMIMVDETGEETAVTGSEPEKTDDVVEMSETSQETSESVEDDVLGGDVDVETVKE